jgi:hypothetical protein
VAGTSMRIHRAGRAPQKVVRGRIPRSSRSGPIMADRAPSGLLPFRLRRPSGTPFPRHDAGCTPSPKRGRHIVIPSNLS